MTLSFYLCAAAAWAQISGTTFADAKKNKTATWVFTYSETPSFSSKQPDGSVQGLAVDIMKKFGQFVQQTEGIKVTVEFKAKNPDDFRGFLEEVKTAKGGVFGLGNVTITEVRKKEYEFSPAFIKNISTLCTNKDVPTLVSLDKAAEAFKGFKAIAVAGSTNEKAVQEIRAKYIPTSVLQQVESNQEAVDAIASNKKAYSNIDFAFYLNAMRKNIPIKRHPVGDQSTEEFGIIMPKSNDWSPLMAKFINAEFLRSDDYRKMLSTNLGSNALKLMDSFQKK